MQGFLAFHSQDRLFCLLRRVEGEYDSFQKLEGPGTQYLGAPDLGDRVVYNFSLGKYVMFEYLNP